MTLICVVYHPLLWEVCRRMRGKTSQHDCMVAAYSAESALPFIRSQQTPDELGHINVSYRREAVLMKVIIEATENQSQGSVSKRVDCQVLGLGGTAGEAAELGPRLLSVALFLLCFGSMVFALEHRYCSESAVTSLQEFRTFCVLVSHEARLEPGFMLPSCLPGVTRHDLMTLCWGGRTGAMRSWSVGTIPAPASRSKSQVRGGRDSLRYS